MNFAEVKTHIEDRLNKLGSNAGENLSARAIAFAFNEMQLHWMDERIRRKGFDQITEEELQSFSKTKEVKSFSNGPDNRYCEFNLPEDYFRYSRVYAKATKGDCTHTVSADLVSDGVVNEWIGGAHTSPSFEWQETFASLNDNKLRFYTDNDFKCECIFFSYYRCPVKIDSSSIEYSDGSMGTDVSAELTKTNLYEVLDLTARLLASDSNDVSRFNGLTDQINRFK